MKAYTTPLLILTLLSVNLFAQNSHPSIPKIDSLIERQIKKDSPGCVVGVIKNGIFIHKKAYGLANLDYDIPLTTSSVFSIASTSKQFTAACIFLLEKQGRINLNDDIRKHLKDFPFYGDTIRIKHLIYHTSGLRDYTGLTYLCGQEDDYQYTSNDLYHLIIRQKELDFRPGTQFSYCNTGYFLLEKIAESVTGVSLNEFSQDNLFVPLGMSNTHFHSNYRMIVKNRAYGYSHGENAYEILMSNNDVVGDGGILTTLDDLSLWDANFYSHTVGGIELYSRMITPGKLNNGSEIPYAGGLFIREFRGLKKINHTGWYAGFKSSIAQYPEENVSIIILANSPDIGPPILNDQIAEVVLKDRLKPRVSSNKSKPSNIAKSEFHDKVTEDILKALPGKYYSSELNFFYEIFRREGKLFCKIGNNKSEEMFFIDKDHLMVGESISLSLVRDKANEISAFSIGVEDIKNIYFERVNLNN